MRKKLLFLQFLITQILIPVCSVNSQDSPAPPPPPPPSEIPDVTASPETPAEEYPADTETGNDVVVIKQGVLSGFVSLQAKGAAFIKKQMDIMKGGFNIRTFLIIILFSLAYGIFHTLGPGHGKLIVMSFFLRDHTTRADAMSLSVLVSAIHSSGAVILAVLFHTLLQSVKGFQKIRLQYGFTIFSGLLIMTIGIVYMVRLIRKKDPGHKPLNSTVLMKQKHQNRWKNNLLIGFSIGIVPCPLSLTIMMLSIIYGIFWVGFTSVISLTLAMVIVLYIISLYTIKSRNFLEHKSKTSKTSAFSRIITLTLNYLGNFFLILLGLYFVYSAGQGLL